ncbi:MAG: type II toxin-antitoxin system RelE/ParE family toxin [Parcubacteria group bacterium]|nr:type II toxin-antitoxin system RelE/ParE family toxin [Parcubacteria group bacterium]
MPAVSLSNLFNVIYHHLVVHDDIPKLSREWKEKVRRAIEERLMNHPDLYGKPLRRSLKGYRKLRVGDYRIIFKIEKNAVRVLIIQHRSIVYGEAEKRM